MPRQRVTKNPRTLLNHEELQPGGELEPGYTRRIPRFSDVVDIVVARKHTLELKRRLREEIDTQAFEQYRTSDTMLKQIKNKNVRKFYVMQNQKLDDWFEVDTIVRAVAEDVMDSMNPDPDHDGHQEMGGRLQNVHGMIEEMLPDEVRINRNSSKKRARLAINVNMLANIVLLVAKGISALNSSSLSLIASLLDSALDLMCTTIIWLTNKVVSWKFLGNRFPVGRRRFEPIGILVFSVIMVISFCQILQDSIKSLIHPGMTDLTTMAIIAIAANVLLKGVIGLACVRIRNSQVQALVQDCKTDVYFNTLSLVFPLIGKYTGQWWLDPTGAIILSVYIIYDWTGTCLNNIIHLCGSSCNMRLQKKLTYLSFRFSPLVSGIKSINAYHMGDGVWAEFDILLDENVPLREVHDVSETLQYCCEALPEVDRAFVSVDYSAQNPLGHSMDNI